MRSKSRSVCLKDCLICLIFYIAHHALIAGNGHFSTSNSTEIEGLGA